MIDTRNEKLELALDIVAVVSILIRTGREDITEDKRLFTQFLNELGFRTLSGKEFTLMNYTMFMKRLPPWIRKEIKHEFEKILY